MNLGLQLIEATADATATVTADEVVSQVTGALTTNGISAETVLTIVVGALGVTAVFAITWFGYRFIKSKVSSAMRKGKL